MLDKITYRDDAYKIAVVIGASYLGSMESIIPDMMAEKGIHAVINCPQTQKGSWYYRLARKTDGLNSNQITC